MNLNPETLKSSPEAHYITFLCLKSLYQMRTHVRSYIYIAFSAYLCTVLLAGSWVGMIYPPL